MYDSLDMTDPLGLRRITSRPSNSELLSVIARCRGNDVGSSQCRSPSRDLSGGFARLLRGGLLRGVSQLLVMLAIANSCDQRVDHGGQLIERGNRNGRLVLSEFQRLEAGANEKGEGSILN